MKPASIQLHSQFDFVDYETRIVATEAYLKSAQERGQRMDRLIADRAYLQTRSANELYKQGRLDDHARQRIYGEIDSQLWDYDDRPSVLYRNELINMLRNLIARLRAAARADRGHRKEARNAA